MVKFKNGEGLRLSSERDLPFLLLIIAGVMEFVFIAMESMFSYIGYYLVEDYIIVPCLLFVGIAMTRKLTHVAKKQMLLAVVAVAWFVVVQMIHKLSGMGTHPIGTVFFIYLMAFPFASVTEDRENRGFIGIAKIMTAASLVLVVYAVMLLFEKVPSVMEPFMFWDGTRLHAFWHPNISACFFMIGIGFAAALTFLADKLWIRVLLVIAVILQFMGMVLTNCRTTLLLTSAFFGCIGFFLIFGKGWKRVVLSVAVALAVMVAVFGLSSKLYDVHTEMQLEKVKSQTAEEAAKENAQWLTVDSKTGEVIIHSDNRQGSLTSDMRTLNGRTPIWKSALSAVRDSKKLMLWGTEYAGATISAYHAFAVVHGHNSWIEALVRMGIPGLLLSLFFTGLAVRNAWVLVWNRNVEIWKKMIAVLTMCVMATGFLEPYLFITNVYYHVSDFIFFFCIGYLDYWRWQVSKENVQ